MIHKYLIVCMLVAASMAQRPFYGRPIGYPVIEPTSTTTQSNNLGNRFGTGPTTTTTTQRLPVEAYGDRDLVERLSKLPEDNQPFWLLNWRALEQHRMQGHTYQNAPSNFISGLAGFNQQVQQG